jgi:hypothetical protein
MPFGSNRLDAKLNVRINEEHRIVVIRTPNGLNRMTDDQILLLLQRARELWAEYDAAEYAVMHAAATRSGDRSVQPGAPPRHDVRPHGRPPRPPAPPRPQPSSPAPARPLSPNPVRVSCP